MFELVAGGLVGLFVGTRFGLSPSGAVVVAVFAAVGLYLASCAIWPRRRCFRCSGAKYRGDGRGNLRDRKCRVCGGKGDLRRVGARLIGAGVRS